jgi:phage shock protein C
MQRIDMNDIHAALARQGLYRARDDRLLGGVCAGLGRRIGLDPWPARLIFLLVLMIVPGSQVLIYPILWLLMPQEEHSTGMPTYYPPPPPPPHA